MTRKHTLLLLLGLLGAAMIGGALAARLSPGAARAAPLGAFSSPLSLTTLTVTSTTADLIVEGEQQISELGVFTIQSPDSVVEITYQGRLSVDSAAGYSGLIFELRVDGQGGPDNFGQFHIPASGAGAEIGVHVPAVFTGVWQNLPAGEHTVSIWAYGMGPSGDATVTLNPGNWPTSVVFVQEFVPFGASYLPVIEN